MPMSPPLELFVMQVGLCPICHEKTARGGEGKKIWLSMKFSAFKWYVNFHAPVDRRRSPVTAEYLFCPLRHVSSDHAGSYHMQYAHGIHHIPVLCFDFVKLTICRHLPIDWSPVFASHCVPYCYTPEPGKAREGAGHGGQVPQVQEVGAR